MPVKVRVNLGERSYDIHIGLGVLAELGATVRASAPGNAGGRVLVIADAAVARHWLDPALASLQAAGLAAIAAEAPPGESAKTLAVAGRLYEACLDAGLDRHGVIVALGGGAVGDLAGFVAATFMRGIPFIQVPTTLLAQVDASVGGKVAVNLPRGKNLVGAFHQPRAVVADLATLRTLSEREYRSGLAEVVKHGIIRDRALFRFLEEHAEAILAQDPPVLEHVVERNCRIKGAVVSADEREGGLRAILNLGHTVGHGLEAVAGRIDAAVTPSAGLLHGECVSVGLVAAAWLAARSGVLAQDDLPARLEALLQRFGLPVRFPADTDLAALQAAMSVDKKAMGGQLRWVLPVRLGQTQVTSHVQSGDVAAVLTELLA